MRSVRFWPALCTALMIGCPSVEAGPPLTIGDTGILDVGQWEIIAATTVVSSNGDDFYQLPVLDVSLGVIKDRLQVSLVQPYAHVDSDDGDWERGLGNLELGLQWRFLDIGNVQIALAPSYTFGAGGSAAERGVGDRAAVAALPVNVEVQINDNWRFNGEVTYSMVDGGGEEDAVGYGAAIAYSASDQWELLMEISGSSDTRFDNGFLDVRIGFDVAASETFHVLFSIGTGVREPRGEDALDREVWFGLQWLL